MKILFIWPNRDTFGVKPIGLSLLIAELKRAGHAVDLFDTTFIDLGLQDYNLELTKRGYFKPVEYGCDVTKKPLDVLEELEKKITAFKPDLFALSVLSDEAEVACRIIGFIEDNYPGPILVGNKGAQKVQHRRLDERCIYFFGEAIGVLPEFIKRKRCHHERVHYPHGYFTDLDSLPYLDWSLFDKRHFLRAYDGKVYRSGDYMIGWGCPNSCTYCINERWREMHGGIRKSMRRYSVGRTIEELSVLTGLWNLDFFKFHDEDFLLKPMPYLEELAVEYDAHVSVPFACMTNARSVTPHRAALLAQMGCVSVSIGIETGDPVMRSILNRKETPEDIILAVLILQNYGIRVSSFNMIGLPWESKKTIEATIALNKRSGIRHPNVSFFVPLEGTKLHDIAVAAGFFSEGDTIRTDTPSLKMPTITESDLYYYYDNFYNLVTDNQS